MRSISSYETGDGRRYKVRYRDPDNRSKEKGGFLGKKDAEEHLANIAVSTASGEYVDPRSAKITIDELGAEWVANQSHLKPSTITVIEIAWRVHIQPDWGRRRIGEIRFSEVQSWVTKFSAGVDGEQRSASVVIRAYGSSRGSWTSRFAIAESRSIQPAA